MRRLMAAQGAVPAGGIRNAARRRFGAPPGCKITLPGAGWESGDVNRSRSAARMRHRPPAERRKARRPRSQGDAIRTARCGNPITKRRTALRSPHVSRGKSDGPLGHDCRRRPRRTKQQGRRSFVPFVVARRLRQTHLGELDDSDREMTGISDSCAASDNWRIADL
jgi:hypothetical protein